MSNLQKPEKMTEPVVTVATKGFITEIDVFHQFLIVEDTFREICPETDFIVFKHTSEPRHKDDEGRSLIVPMNIPKTVYAKLDDFHDSETLSENMGEKTTARYVLTWLLAEEY